MLRGTWCGPPLKRGGNVRAFPSSRNLYFGKETQPIRLKCCIRLPGTATPGARRPTPHRRTDRALVYDPATFPPTRSNGSGSQTAERPTRSARHQAEAELSAQAKLRTSSRGVVADPRSRLHSGFCSLMRRKAFAVAPSIVRAGDVFRDRLSQHIDVAHRHVCLEKRNADARLLERLEDGSKMFTAAH